MPEYEVTSDYGCATFRDEQDAINALFLIGAYHNIKIDNESIKKALDKKGSYECFPLSITK